MRLRHGLIAALFLIGLGSWAWLTFVPRPSDQSYALIEPNLYAGEWVAQPPPGAHAVINLCDQKDPYRAPIHLDMPIDGTATPSVEWLTRVVNIIDEQRSHGATVYVHCLGGVNRTGMVITAYLIHAHGWSAAEALAFAQSKRPQFSPNPVMLRFLGEWERHCKQRS
jgi:hypothetical protein